MKKKVLVTGSSGMLGRALCDVLSRCYQVFGMDLENRINLCQFLKCDITRRQEVDRVFSGVYPDAVIHTAAYTDVDGCEINKEKADSVNRQGALNIATACRKSGAALFFISTDYVFDGKKKGPYRESDMPSPLNIYGRTKLEAEEFIRNSLPRYFIIRTSWLYGASGKNFVDTIRAAAQSKPLLKVVDDQIGGPTYVSDLAEAIKNLLNRVKASAAKYSGIYHITNSGKCSWYRLAGEIARLNNLTAKIVPIKSSQLCRPAQRPKNSLLNNSKFNRLVHKPMRHWKKALTAYLKICPAI